MLKSVLGTNCDVDRLVPWLRRGPVRVPLFSPEPGFCLSKMSLHRPAEFLFTFRLLLFSRLFSLISPPLAFVLFLRQGRGWYIELYLQFFLSFLRVYHVHSFFLFSFSPFFFSSFFFCMYYEFIFAEDLCVHLPLLLISFSFSGGFFVKVFLLF